MLGSFLNNSSLEKVSSQFENLRFTISYKNILNILICEVSIKNLYEKDNIDLFVS